MVGINTYINFDIYKPFPELVCAFSTRLGGSSKGIFSNQNMGNTRYDHINTVLKNRKNYYKRLNIDKETVVLPRQYHSANVKIATSVDLEPKTDALFTQNTGIFLGVQTADCFPVFIYDAQKKAVGIIHAGWRGVTKGIISKTLKIMKHNLQSKYSNFHVAIGPGLQKECFEVRADVYKQFPEKYLGYHPENFKKNLDLLSFLVDEMISLGVPAAQIEVNSDCTKCRHDLYYSYRRDKEKSGRMLGIIGIRSEN
jgi:YfiH family protein